jgi:acyl-CoA synthetase (NDP forming)
MALVRARYTMGEPNPLEILFNPKSIAIVGASGNPLTPNYNLLANLVKLQFPGKLYPVNPNVREIDGMRAYPSLKSIEGEIDMVVSSVPAAATLDIIKDCVQKRVKVVVIVSGGFSEVGQDGRKAQEEIARLLKQAGIRAIGPNCLSPINTSNNLVIGFDPHEKLHKGSTSFIMQSGFYEPRLEWIFSDFNLGMNKLIDLGNKIDINEVDALEYLAWDPTTRVIAIHLESIAGDSRRFFDLLQETSKEKPIVVLKSGRTEAGAAAASSHTGAIVKGSPIIFDIALTQAGVVRAYTLDEFLDFAKIFEFLTPLKLTGNRIAIACLSGGEGAVVTDTCQERGFSLAKVNPETYIKLQEVGPPWKIPANPFDIGVSGQFHPMEVYQAFFEAMTDDTNVDCIAAQLPTFRNISIPDNILRAFLEPIFRARSKKPVAIWLMEETQRYRTPIQLLEANRVPVYPTADRAIKALSALYRYTSMRTE